MPIKYADMLIVEADELLTIQNISKKPKVKNEMGELGIIKNGAVAIKDGLVAGTGFTDDISDRWYSHLVFNAKGKVVMPGFVDCHTHTVFAGSREHGEDIYYTVKKTRKADFNWLLEDVDKRLKKILAHGTTTIEIKSGYGLGFLHEAKLLNIISDLKKKSKIDIVSTFLGAHVYPKDYKKESYLSTIIYLLSLPKLHEFAEYCDVWCEECAFSLKETEKILRKAKEKGFKIKLHAGQFKNIGAVELGVEYGAASIDHLDFVSDKGVEMMAKSKTVGVLLPGVSFHSMADHYAPARRLIDAGVPIALATDFNPGSSPIISMQIIIGLACCLMKMTPAEAITASTINAAYAVDMADKIGSLEEGKQADIIVLDVPNHLQIPYWFGQNLVGMVIKKGKVEFS